MEVTKHYDNLAERQQKIVLWEGQGYWVLHDDFDDPTAQDTFHGTLTFTNTVIPPTEEQQKEMLADQKMAELRELLKQGAEVVVTNPPEGKTKVTNIFVDPASEEIEHNEVV